MLASDSLKMSPVAVIVPAGSRAGQMGETFLLLNIHLRLLR